MEKQKKYLYTIIDNFSGIKYQMNNIRCYKQTMEELKDSYTEKEEILNQYIWKPYYIITSEQYFEDNKMYVLTYIDIKK